MSVSSISGPLQGAASGAVPQVRSRSVSLRIGSFGLTYATDQVFWRELAPQAGAERPPVEAVARAEGSPGGAGTESTAAQAQAAPAQTSREFARQLLAARRRARSGYDSATNAALSPPQARESAGTEATAAATAARAAAATGSAAMDRAIGAYLACAASLSRPAPMLRAVA